MGPSHPLLSLQPPRVVTHFHATTLDSHPPLLQSCAQQQAEDLAVLPTDITPEPSTQQSGGNTALIVGLVVAGVVAVCVGALLVVLLRHKRHKRQLLAAHLKQQADAQHGLVRHGSGASSNGSGEASG